MAEGMKARIVEQANVLLVGDLTASVRWFEDRLGFSRRGVWGDPPDFAILRRDAAFVMLSQAPTDHVVTPYWRTKDKLWNAYFWVDDARAMHAELTERGAAIDYGLCEQPYGVLEFGVQDLDGHDIAFGQDLE